MSVTSSPDQLHAEWLEHLKQLIGSVQSWAEEQGWKTRQIEIGLEDSQIGKYKAPALLLQQEAMEMLLEPIALSGLNHQGVVDLYRLPRYDDIASICRHDDGWHIHYMFSSAPSAADIYDAPAKPLTRESLQEVLSEMKKNA
jgi:hypothetical protein